MSGSAPQVTLTAAPVGPYTAGDLFEVTATIVDADDGTETLTGVDGLGRHVTATIVRDDEATITWMWQSTAEVAGTGNPLQVAAPAVSDVLSCLVTDAQGNTTMAVLPVEVTVPMLVGVDNPSTSPTVSQFPRMKITRVFGSPGKGIPGWSTSQMKVCVQLGVIPHVSFKDTPTVAMVSGWMDGIPPGVRAYLTFHHEPEGDLPPEVYAAGWTTLGQAVAAHPNRDRVTLVGVLGSYAELHGKGPWQTWWTGVEQVMGWDMYVPVGSASYPTPATFFAPLITAAHGAGVPWMVPELGSPILAGDTGGARYAAWLTACVAYLRTAGCVAVSVWDTNGGNGVNYTLTGAPLAAWQQAVATQ